MLPRVHVLTQGLTAAPSPFACTDEVPQMSREPPADHCYDIKSTCCCNSISFALSMLCLKLYVLLSCQWLAKDGASIDASSGAYYQYRWGDDVTYCGDGTNQSLPVTVQTSVCESGMRLDDALYTMFWADGSCTSFRNQWSLDDITHGNGTFTHCGNNSEAPLSTPSSVAPGTRADTIRHASTSTAALSTTTTQAYASSGAPYTVHKVNIGAIVGSIVGAGLALLAFCAVLRMRRQKTNTRTPYDRPSMMKRETVPLSPYSAPLVQLGTAEDSRVPTQPASKARMGLQSNEHVLSHAVAASGSGSQAGMDATMMTPLYTEDEDNVAGDWHNGERVECALFTLGALEPVEDAGQVDTEEFPPPPAYRSSWGSS
ncbi:hypothetical protein POSPLADRAFT_1139360 [Postia placenta MAD-698-R-SB12]|uniref:Uncharacterized protein n=1 Tax=Postia placenta MAD-698-R-SB12 TaxID=670580 RepID=A0A1X6N3Z6_9APHY|nr:hypothetical protein POSPLADRAFT_1139360 [Postia placenta MAD-698-R-SB12]OSX63162.1 hypothetical protein POSPLADRAFT_1139360 [Postia placenta MAD-698-R-SB12]